MKEYKGTITVPVIVQGEDFIAARANIHSAALAMAGVVGNGLRISDQHPKVCRNERAALAHTLTSPDGWVRLCT